MCTGANFVLIYLSGFKQGGLMKSCYWQLASLLTNQLEEAAAR